MTLNGVGFGKCWFKLLQLQLQWRQLHLLASTRKDPCDCFLSSITIFLVQLHHVAILFPSFVDLLHGLFPEGHLTPLPGLAHTSKHTLDQTISFMCFGLSVMQSLSENLL